MAETLGVPGDRGSGEWREGHRLSMSKEMPSSRSCLHPGPLMLPCQLVEGRTPRCENLKRFNKKFDSFFRAQPLSP